MEYTRQEHVSLRIEFRILYRCPEVEYHEAIGKITLLQESKGLF